jgi:phosphoglycolate phosphatase
LKPRNILFKNIIFDLDGTLIDSSGDIIDCLIKAYKKTGDFGEIKVTDNHIGPPLTEIIANITPFINKKKVNEIIKVFRRYYDNSQFPKTRLFPYVRRLINKLEKSDSKIFIVTNKPLVPTMRIINKLRINLFEDILALDYTKTWLSSKKKMIRHLIKKYNLNTTETVLIGDSISDIESARHSGIESIFVLNGYTDSTPVLTNSATVIVKSIKDLAKTFFYIR